ncbi:MAG: 5-formyltetrahydrofolate cyclo-ligase [Legionellaceae bacterium]|nr:5-formyltetrahydrofolate cyclo-ligase [Legionellaceae bacterium]
MDKPSLRTHFKQLRERCSKTEQVMSSEAICQRIIQLPLYQQAKTIALYRAKGKEVLLDILWKDALRAGKCIAFPVIQHNALLFIPATATTIFKKNQFGIEEPVSPYPPALVLDNLDLVCCPLLAYDKQGHRLGYGGGFYDRSFQNHSHLQRLGVAFSFQEAPTIPRDPWDLPLHVIVTEKTTHWILP